MPSQHLTPLVAAQIFGVPLLIDQTRLEVILSAIGPRLGVEAIEIEFNAEKVALARQQRAESLAAMLAGENVRATYEDAGYYLARDVAVVPLIGTLVHRGSWMGSMSGLLGYDEHKQIVAAALKDDRVARIVYEVDSPGGSASGAFDYADWLYAQRGVKPSVSMVNEFAASGGFLLAAAASPEIVMTRTAHVGSVGVVMSHVDRSAEMKQIGRAVTFVYAGEKKVDGHPYGPLPKRVVEEMQASVEKTYDLFTSVMSKYLGVSEKVVRDTQAGVLDAEAAVVMGFAHRIEGFDTELSNQVFSRSSGGRRLDANQKQKELSMPDPTQISAEDLAKQVAAARTEGAKLATARIQAIMNSEDAKGRTELATHIAYNTAMTVEDAAAMLKASPAAVAATPLSTETPLDKAMRANGSPDIKNPPLNTSVAAPAVEDTSALFDRRAKEARAYRTA